MTEKHVFFEINGENFVCSPGNTQVHLYRKPEDAVYNHATMLEYGTQRHYLFNAPRYLMYLSGIPMPDDGLDKKEMKQLTESMDAEVGWNADVLIQDEAPEEIKERYIRLSSKVLEAAQVFVPTDW